MSEDGELQSCGEYQFSESLLVSEDNEIVYDQEENLMYLLCFHPIFYFLNGQKEIY